MERVANAPNLVAADGRRESWPIVPRDNELAAVRAALGCPSEVSGIVITGDHGVGKTTLAQMALAEIARDASPARVHTVAGTESAQSIPLGAFARLLEAAPPREPVALLASAREAVVSGQYSIIFVDDAHLLDPLSASLLHHLMLDESVRVIATVRSDRTLPDAITSLWKNGYLTSVQVSPFSKDECIGLVENALGGRLEQLSADLIWDGTGGNALFVRHLVRGALDARTLRRAGSVWQLRGNLQITTELALLLERELGTPPWRVRHTLELLALCEPLDLQTLREVVGHRAIEDAESRGLIVLCGQPHDVNVRFRHQMFGAFVRGRLGRAAAHRLRDELVDALKRRPAIISAEQIWMAQMAIDSADGADAPLLALGGRAAINMGDLVLGERLTRAASERGGGMSSVHLLVWALLCQGRDVEAEQILIAIDPRALNERGLIRWGAARLVSLRWFLDDAEAADDVLAMLRSKLTDPALLLLVDGIASCFAVYADDLEAALSLAKSVLASPAPAAAVPWAVVGGVMAAALMGHGHDALALMARGDAIDAKFDGMLRLPMIYAHVRALTLLGEFDAAVERSAQVIPISSVAQRLAWASANVTAASVDLARGRFGDVVTRMEDTLDAPGPRQPGFYHFPARLLLAQAYSVLGRAVPAANAIADLRREFGRHVAVLEPQLLIAEAWQAASEGDTGTAVDRACEAARMSADSGQRATEMLALHDAVRFGDRSVLHRLIETTDHVDGVLAVTIGVHAGAVLRHDPQAILGAAQRFEEIGALLSAADAAAQAAVAFRSAGDRHRAIDASATASRLAIACGRIRTPALNLTAQPLPLTTRERQIVNLVAAGLSNREVAELLQVSVRTVEGHVYRASVKLDTSDRDQLAALVARHASE